MEDWYLQLPFSFEADKKDRKDNKEVSVHQIAQQMSENKILIFVGPFFMVIDYQQRYRSDTILLWSDTILKLYRCRQDGQDSSFQQQVAS